MIVEVNKPLNESVNLFTIVDLPVFGLPIMAIIGSKLACTGKLWSDSGSSYLAIILFQYVRINRIRCFQIHVMDVKTSRRGDNMTR